MPEYALRMGVLVWMLTAKEDRHINHTQLKYLCNLCILVCRQLKGGGSLTENISL